MNLDAPTLSSEQPEGGEDGAVLLEDIVRFQRRFVSMTGAQADAVALWNVHTHCIDAADTTPYFNVKSPEKRSGKSRLLEINEQLVARPWKTERVSAAVLVRKIDDQQSTLLLDESDAAFKSDKEYAQALRGVLNSGFRRGGKTSLCVTQGRKITYQDFSTFSAKMIAGIGEALPDTVTDRSVPIAMKRCGPGERVERLRLRKLKTEAAPLRERIERWSAAHLERLTDAEPELPEALDDRAQDIWEPLIVIADVVGGEWPERARQAAVALSGNTARADGSAGVRLLGAVRAIFDRQGLDRIASAELVTALCADDEGPWREWAKGRSITQRGVARLLNGYGIGSVTVRLEAGRTAKGYYRAAFNDAWDRYLAIAADLQADPSDTASQPNEYRTAFGIPIRHTVIAVTEPNSDIAHAGGTRDGVTVERPTIGPERASDEPAAGERSWQHATLDERVDRRPMLQLPVSPADPSTWPAEYVRWCRETVKYAVGLGMDAREADRIARLDIQNQMRARLADPAWGLRL